VSVFDSVIFHIRVDVFSVERPYVIGFVCLASKVPKHEERALALLAGIYELNLLCFDSTDIYIPTS
jgi:hypothetical protein